MAVIELTSAELTGAAGAIAPRRRRARAAAGRIGSGIAVLIPIVVLSSFITYCLGALSNSNPAATILGQDAATPAAVAHLDHVLGLDKPLVVQYWDWLTQALHGNLGVVLLHPDPGVAVASRSGCRSTCRSRSPRSSWRS